MTTHNDGDHHHHRIGEIGTDAGGHLVELPYPFLPGGAIFDCDGTLADTMPLHFQAWNETLAGHDDIFPEDLFYAWGGVTTPEIVERLNARHGLTLDPLEVAHAKEERYHRLIPQVGPVAAIVAEVHRLHGRCPLAVASGGMRVVVNETLRTLGLLPYFDAVVTAEDVARGKPEPDTFLLAAERLGVPARDCIVYEDSPVGLEAARRAGMRAVDVRPHLGGV
uniref:Beta-phosphoglucomutase n=1 Tax=uncultured Armatimonadetes bacterium TaxID=157466 RepID=A0A6J4JJ88_9BACT|nr:Beta-phosphoglucomutase [uncultured Armatimonadetes bacterium]